MADDTECLNELISLQNNTDWNIEEQRREIFSKLYPLIEKWKGPLPNLLTIFRPEQINWLIIQDCTTGTSRKIINFAIRTGYRDQPDVGEDGKPAVQHTTPIHYWAEDKCDSKVVRELFMIYDRFDVNYIDDFGNTHFHVACEYGLEDVVEKFLEQGQDPNCPMPRTGESPLRLAVANRHREVAALLLEADADPNLTNDEGSTPLHLICQHTYDEMAKMPCEPSSIQVGPLMALISDYTQTVKWLVKKGADPNAADARGRTPLHIVCQGKYNVIMFTELMKICKDEVVRVDIHARDNEGRTAFDVAKEHDNTCVINELLLRGAEPYLIVEE